MPVCGLLRGQYGTDSCPASFTGRHVLSGGAGYDEILGSMCAEAIRKNGLRAFVAAARPRTLAAAAVPVAAGCALAAADGCFLWPRAVLCFAFALLMQVDANLINDLGDFRKGSDDGDRLGPPRACAMGWVTVSAMRTAIAVTTVAACLAGCGLLACGGWKLLLLGALCVLFAFLYTTGPYPLAYHGWGDVLVLLFFGLVPVGGTYYVMAGNLTPWILPLAAACGLAVDTLLLVNNYRDREQDARSGKRTLVVRLGAAVGSRLYLWTGVGACLLCLLLIGRGAWFAALLPTLYLVPHVAAWRRMVRIGSGRALNAILADTSRNMLLFGALLVLGMLL